MFVTWLIVLIAGRMPRPLHEALAAALRYQTRVIGYFLMLTARYPGGLFGDPAAFGAGPADSVPGGICRAGDYRVTGAPRPLGQLSGPVGRVGLGGTGRPGPGPAGPDQPGPGRAPGYGQPRLATAAALATASPAGLRRGRAGPARATASPLAVRAARRPVRWLGGDQPWRLVLSQAAKRLIILFLVLGAIFAVGYIALIGGSPRVRVTTP